MSLAKLSKKKNQAPAPNSDARSGSSKLLFSGGALALLLAFLFKAFIIPLLVPIPVTQLPASPDLPDHDRFCLRHYNIVGGVPVLTWDPKTPFVRQIIQRNEPVVLRNTVVSTWPALRRWSPALLAQRAGPDIFKFHSIKDNNVYLYSQPKPLAKLPELGFQEPSGFSRRNLKEFWAHAATMDNFTNARDPSVRKGKNWLYFTGILDRSEQDVQEFPSLLAEVPNIKEAFVANEDFYAINIWFGTRGLTAQTHYDEAPNFSTQIYGHKRWILSPPRFVN